MKLIIITQKVNQNDPILGFFHEWLKEFAKRVEKLTVIALEAGEYDLPKNVEVLSLGKEKLIEADKRGWLRGFTRIRFVVRFYFLIWKLRKEYDGIFVHMNPEYVVLGGWFWRLMGKKIILWYTHKSVTWQLKIANLFVNKIFTASIESCRLKNRNKIKVVGHGIDLEVFKPDDEQKIFRILKLLTVGRISASKDLETIILAVNQLAKEGEDAVLDIVGSPVLEQDFAYLEILKDLIRKLGMEDKINFLGSVRHGKLPEIYKEHNIFIHTSRTGSVDKVMLEAMASGLNVLSSSEAFGFLEDKYKFRSNNVDDLVEKIKNLENNNPSQLREIVREKHNFTELIGRIVKFYVRQ